MSLVPTVFQSNREIGTCRGHWGERRVCGCQSRVGGQGTRAPGGMVVVNRDGRAIHRKRSEVAAADTHNSDSDSQ